MLWLQSSSGPVGERPPWHRRRRIREQQMLPCTCHVVDVGLVVHPTGPEDDGLLSSGCWLQERSSKGVCDDQRCCQEPRWACIRGVLRTSPGGDAAIVAPEFHQHLSAGPRDL